MNRDEFKPAPYWMIPYGILAISVSMVAFIASASQVQDARTGLIAGLHNPFFFAGLPLGIYWLHRGLRNRKRRRGELNS